MLKPTYEKNLLDLKYNRHLENTHTFFIAGVTLSIGVLGVIATIILSRDIELNDIEIFTKLIYISLVPLSLIWAFFTPLIQFQRGTRKRIVVNIYKLGKKESI